MASAGYPDGPGPGDEKHFKARQRERRFDAGLKFGGLHGRTATGCGDPWGPPDWMRHQGVEDTEMTVERPETDEGIAVSAFDLNAMQRPELLTPRPVKEGLGEELCEELQKLCVSSSMHRHPESPDFALRIFDLPVVGYRKGGEKRKADDRVLLHLAPARREPDVVPPTFATLLAGPPEEVLEQTLLRRARFSWNGCAELPAKKSDRSGGVRPSKVAVGYPTQRQLQLHNDMCLDCWVQDAPESYLEVDLGANCHVTHVSTLGRFPPVERYPTCQEQREWDRMCAEGGPAAAGSGSIGRQTWAVVKPGAKGWEQWVTRYQLQARLDGGRVWKTIDSLKGNTDMTTEVAHDLRELCRNEKGLQCRYLRFLPEGHHGKPAMRIGVYGVSSQREQSNAEKHKEEERVRYTIPVPLLNRNRRRRARDGISRRAYSPDWYGKYGGTWRICTRRKIRARETREEATEALGRDRKALLKRQDSACYDPGAGEVEAEAEAEAVREAEAEAAGGAGENVAEAEEPAPDQPPRLQRAVSRRIEEALSEQPVLQHTRTDEHRGYCSEPEDLLADWTLSDDWTLL